MAHPHPDEHRCTCTHGTPEAVRRGARGGVLSGCLFIVIGVPALCVVLAVILAYAGSSGR